MLAEMAKRTSHRVHTRRVKAEKKKNKAPPWPHCTDAPRDALGSAHPGLSGHASLDADRRDEQMEQERQRVDNMLVESIFTFRQLMNEAQNVQLSMRNMVERAQIRYPMKDKTAAVFITLTGLTFSGIDKNCFNKGCHTGFPGNGWSSRVYHGTRKLFEVLGDEGTLTLSGRPLHQGPKTFHGWYHSESFETALQYGAPHRPGDGFFKPVLEVVTTCQNALRGRTWRYTRSGCSRYEVVGVFLVPCQQGDCAM